MKHFLRVLAGCTLATAMLAVAAAAHAQAWPSKPIRMIMPLAAGGTTDVAARVIAGHLTEVFGQSVLIENRTGANGIIGVQAGAKAAPDGYTFVVGSSTTMAANNFLYKNAGTEPLKDFTAVAMLGTLDFVLVVPASSPYQTLQELIADAKANPGKLTYGYGSSGSLLCSETFRSAAGIDILKIPYQSTPQAVTDLAGGRLSMLCDAAGTTVPLVKAGKLRFLAATGKQRDPMMADVPTMLESKVPMTHQTWAGFFAPAQTPPEIVNRMSAEIVKLLGRPDVQEKVREQGFKPVQIGASEFAAIHRAEYAKTAGLIKQAGIEPE